MSCLQIHARELETASLMIFAKHNTLSPFFPVIKTSQLTTSTFVLYVEANFQRKYLVSTNRKWPEIGHWDAGECSFGTMKTWDVCRILFGNKLQEPRDQQKMLKRSNLNSQQKIRLGEVVPWRMQQPWGIVYSCFEITLTRLENSN